MDAPVPVELSPKDQAYAYGDVPPLAKPANVTCCPAFGEDELKAKLTVSVWGGLETETDC